MRSVLKMSTLVISTKNTTKSTKKTKKSTKKTTKHTEPVTLDDINTFRSMVGSGRKNNDANNKKREAVILQAQEMNSSHEFFEDKRWTDLKKKLDKCLSTILLHNGITNYDNYVLRQTAGRKNNFDYFLDASLDTKTIFQNKVEFKHDKNGSIEKLPQVLSLLTGTTNYIGSIRYDEYFHDNYLDKIIEVYENNSELKLSKLRPNKTVYLTEVQKNTSNMKFFILMKDKIKNCKTCEKLISSVVAESIENYILSRCMDNIDVTKVIEKLQITQDQKQFIIWDIEDFRSSMVAKEAFDIQNQYETKKSTKDRVHTIVFTSKNNKYRWEFLLRWKNKKGILCPAWQIKYVIV